MKDAFARADSKGAAGHASRATADLAGIPLAEVMEFLHSSEDGLSAQDAAAILKSAGPNRIDTAKRKSLLIAFAERFSNPLVLILLFAAGVSAFTGDVASFVIITIIVLMSVILDVTQERQAQNAADKLREQVALSATALRDGKPAGIPATEIVPGDIVLLAAGDLVPADGRLIEARDLYVDEALLTGEAYPVEKQAAPPTAQAASEITFPSNLVFSGSSVVSGTAKALVLATGPKTQLGSIASALQKEPPPTTFAIGIKNFGMMIVWATIFLVLFVVLFNLLFHRPLIESFLFALALAVGLTPELLPMIVSVTLAHGSIRMAHRDVIVKRQSAIDDLGSMDVFCSDKTGTLTEARIKLVREVDLSGKDSSRVMRMAQLNAAFETGLKSPLDEAILAAARIDLAAWRKIDEVPFDFQRRRVSILVEGEGRRLLIVKGAPEDVLRLADHYEEEGSARPLDEAARRTAEATFNALGADGFRALGVAWREVGADRQNANVADEAELVFAGFLAFLDPPKAGARAALTELAGLGVAVKVVTGDNEQVTRHVCGELGLRITGTLTGSEVQSLTDEALSARLADTTLFCRVTPPQKSRIIAAFRRKGHTVGYLGDGINDAPPLHAADVGFSVDSAVDVAKKAAAIILLRKDLAVLAEGVREGRRTFVNIIKYMMMGTSSNFGNMFSMAAGVLFLPFLPMLPTQILLNNLLYDLSETTIPLDRVADAMIERPRRWDIDIIRKFMLVFGPLSSVFDFVTFGLLLWVFRADEKLFHTGWFVESLSTQILVIFIIRTVNPLRDRPAPALVASTLAAFVAAVALPYLPFAHWLGFVPLPAPLLGALALVTVTYLAAVYGVKRWFFAHYRLD
ncbi:MAG: magnesium-translocating P-type ATPase [Rhodomicrobium sp.]